MNQLAEQLLDLARKAGASHAEIYQAQSHSRPVFFEANRLKQLESSQAQGIALRIWRDNCPGLAVAYGLVKPEILVEKALAISQLNEPETIELNEKANHQYPDLGNSLEPEKLIEIGKEAIAQIREHYPEILCSAELECETESTLLINSQGLYCQHTDTSISYSFGVEWVRGEDFLGIYDGDEVRANPNPSQVIQNILQRLDWAKKNTSSPTGKIPVLFTPSAATMLWGIIEEAANGKRVVEGSSPWSDKKGEIVASSLLNISQQPEKEALSCPFDDEGTLTKAFNLLENGKLQQFYSDRTVGRILGMGTTGNGFRTSLSRYPTPSLVNLIVEPGQSSFEQLIASLDKGLIIDQILGGGPDISGDFSINIDLGYKVHRGQIVGRVKDTMVSGNVYEALTRIVALGNDLRWNGSYYNPSAIALGLSVVT